MVENEIVLLSEGLPEKNRNQAVALISPVPSLLLARVPEKVQGLLLRMFTDPFLLDKAQRADLISSLRVCVADNPQVAELRVLLGMALCVNFEVPDAIAELEESVRLSPGSFIAQLKIGELWMRLRAMDKAESHTRQAALLAANMPQAELARRQAAAIRTMKQNGIERGGYKSPLALVPRLRKLWNRNRSEALATVDAS